MGTETSVNGNTSASATDVVQGAAKDSLLINTFPTETSITSAHDATLEEKQTQYQFLMQCYKRTEIRILICMDKMMQEEMGRHTASGPSRVARCARRKKAKQRLKKSQIR